MMAMTTRSSIKVKPLSSVFVLAWPGRELNKAVKPPHAASRMGRRLMRVQGAFFKRKKRVPPPGQLVALVPSVAGKSCHVPVIEVLVCKVTHWRPCQEIGMLPPEGEEIARAPKD